MADALSEALDQFNKDVLYAAADEAKAREDYLNIGKPWARPLNMGMSLGVHPEQVEEARERARKAGVNVEYKANGDVLVPDRNERRKLLKLEGLIDRKSYTGY